MTQIDGSLSGLLATSLYCTVCLAALPKRKKLSKLLHVAGQTVVHRTLISPVLLNDYTPSRQLRSSDRQLLSQPADNTVFTSRAFSSTVPRIWNSLPITVRSAPSSDTLRRHLKTHLFSNNTAIY